MYALNTIMLGTLVSDNFSSEFVVNIFSQVSIHFAHFQPGKTLKL